MHRPGNVPAMFAIMLRRVARCRNLSWLSPASMAKTAGACHGIIPLFRHKCVTQVVAALCRRGRQVFKRMGSTCMKRQAGGQAGRATWPGPPGLRRRTGIVCRASNAARESDLAVIRHPAATSTNTNPSVITRSADRASWPGLAARPAPGQSAARTERAACARQRAPRRSIR